MAEIHDVTLTPGKDDLVTAWIGDQRWYAAKGASPRLHRVDSWRLDDPAGEVVEHGVVHGGELVGQVVAASDVDDHRAAGEVGADVADVLGVAERAGGAAAQAARVLDCALRRGVWPVSADHLR